MKMKRIFNILILIVALFTISTNAFSNRLSSKSYYPFGTTTTKRPITEEDEAELILRRARENVNKYYLYIRYKFLNNLADNERSLHEFREFKNELALNLSRYNYDAFKSHSLKRETKRLSQLQLEGLPSGQYDNAKRLLKQMEYLSLQDNVNNLEYSVKYPYNPAILKKIQTSNEPDELLHYWKEWRNATSASARRMLTEYRNLYRKAATLNGHITPSKTWYLYYEDDEFLEKLTKVMEDLMPLYKELHAYTRHSIREKYNNKVSYFGPIPHHFMEQIIEQDWYSKSAFTVPNPHNTLPDVNTALKEVIHDGFSLLQNAIRFYEKGLGLSELPQTFYDNYTKPLTEAEALVECKSIVEKFPPDYGIKYCPKIGFKKFLQMHQAVAKLEYFKESINNPYGLDDEACPGFADAIGEAAVIAAGSPRHLDKMGVVENYTFNEEWKMNRLFRMAVHTLFSIFQYFVNEKFWVDFLDQKISDKNMNCEYWKIQQEWAGVSPPEERNERTFDAGYKLYKGISDKKSSTRSLMSEILGYQFYKAFCKANDEYKFPYNTNITLSTCDIFGNYEVGKEMSEMMSKGSTEHWHDVMEILTKTRGLDASAMMEYYSPLYTWLKDYNNRNSVRVGWDSKDLCDDDTD